MKGYEGPDRSQLLETKLPLLHYLIAAERRAEGYLKQRVCTVLCQGTVNSEGIPQPCNLWRCFSCNAVMSSCRLISLQVRQIAQWHCAQ
jgi:hypothetical protein